MKDIYLLLLLVLTAVGSSITTMYAPKMVARIKPYFTWKKRKNISARVEWLEGRAKIHDNQNKGFHNRMDELEGMIDNLAKASKNREHNRDQKVKKAVLDYLTELQK